MGKTRHRREPTVTHGWVNWPSEQDDYKDSGEGGLAVYAIWNQDTPEVCLSSTFGRLTTDVILTKDGHRPPVMHDEYMSGFVYLGSTGGSWWSEDVGHYFQATAEDLTDEGKALVKALSDLYGYEPVIVTFLDT